MLPKAAQPHTCNTYVFVCGKTVWRNKFPSSQTVPVMPYDVHPRLSILVLDEAECSDAELSGAVTAPSNSFFE